MMEVVVTTGAIG